MKEIYRVWKNPGFWFSIGLGVFSMLYPHMDTHYFWQTPLAYFASGDFLYFMLMPLTYGLIKLLLPFIAVLPAAAFLAEDQQRRYHLMLYHRYGVWGYMRHRMSLTVGAAMLAAAMGYLLYAVFAAFACPWHDHIVASWRNLSGFPFDQWVNAYEGIPFLLRSSTKYPTKKTKSKRSLYDGLRAFDSDVRSNFLSKGVVTINLIGFCEHLSFLCNFQ